jgi:hypothetical protein
MINIAIQENGSKFLWQITARDTNEVIRRDSPDVTTEGNLKTFEVPESEAGYFFQYNGHTAFLLNIVRNSVAGTTSISYRMISDVGGLDFDGNKIVFDIMTVKLRVPPLARFVGGIQTAPIIHNLEQHEPLVDPKPDRPNEPVVYRLKILKGAKFLMLSSATIEGVVRLGNETFKILPDGDVQKYVSVRASSIEGIAKDVPILGAFYAGWSRTKKPVIIANRLYWNADTD